MSSDDAIKLDERVLSRLSKADQARARALLRQVREGIRQNPLEAYYPYGKQIEVHSSKARTRMFIGGNRAGKTTFGAADDLIQALPPEFVPDRLKPFKKYGWDEPFKGRVITPDLGHTMEVVIQKFRELCPRAALVGGEWGRQSFDKTRRVLRFENGSTIDFLSTEQEPDKFGGVDLHRVHYDEEPSGPNVETIWQESRWRLLDHGGDILLTMTPLLGYALVYDKVYKPFREGDKSIFVVRASVWDNPHIKREEIEAAIEDMSDEERRAREHGEFVHFAGQFFPEFSEANHVKPSPDPKLVQDRTVIVGIDPGLNYTGIVWVAFDDNNTAFVFDELYLEGQIPAQIVDQIHEVNARWRIRPTYYVIDPAARQGSLINAENVESEYLRLGIPTVPGQNQRAPGILEVKRRLQQGGLYIGENCRTLIRQIPHYRKDPKAQDEFAAIKEDDHELDALRYVLMERPWVKPKPRERPRPRGWQPGKTFDIRSLSSPIPEYS